jgi:GNAT superfamily N-acetyltransferase
LLGVLTAEALWDWLYVDELWVSLESRGRGLGTKLIETAWGFAKSEKLYEVWLWTQSWRGQVS